MSGELNTYMPNWWSWPALSAIGSLLAVFVALFGEKIRGRLFRPSIVVREFGNAVAKERIQHSDPISYGHYLEIFQKGAVIHEFRIEVLAFEHLGEFSRIVWVPELVIASGPLLVARQTVLICEATEFSEMPRLNFSWPDHPWKDRYTDPHYRGRMHVRVIGENFRSAIWPVDLVRDSNLTSGWRLEVHDPVSEKDFLSRRRNYIHEHNQAKKEAGLP